MLTAEERLIPVRVKVKRAKKHVACLEETAEEYRDAYSHVVVGNDGVRKLPVIHFDMLAIAGDALHNLRSALDHVVYPSFSTLSVPEREEYKQPVTVQSLVQRHHDERQALVPTLQLLVAGVEAYVEQFAPYLVKEKE